MKPESPYVDVPVIGERPPQEIARVLEEFGDVRTASLLRQTAREESNPQVANTWGELIPLSYMAFGITRFRK